jgi:hypothetical protein
MAHQTEVRVSYSVGAKINVGNYQNIDIHVSETETWNVESETQEAIDTLSQTRYNDLKQRLDDRLSESIVEAQNG